MVQYELVQYEGRFQLTNHRHFNLRSQYRSREYQCHIESAKSSSAVKSYIEKGGEYEDWGEFQIDGRSARGSQTSAADVYVEALNADKIFQVPIPPYVSPYSPESFNQVPEQMLDWARNNIMNDAARPDRPISIIIEGPSRIGKTKWARSLDPHNYLSGHLDLNSKVYSNDAYYNVIDDIAPHYLFLKHWKHFIGAQRDWQTNCKYGKPIQIKGGIPTIVLCNPDVQSSFSVYLNKDENNGLKIWTSLNSIFMVLDEKPLYTQAQEPTVTETATQSVQNQEVEITLVKTQRFPQVVVEPDL
ncbi:hypothetical protein RHGRI_013076 [Rhododendron griersonianum]|uniref:Replication-associated protein n=1 Tax=Rhododendron griersonianum TaxID=479676 RepID=A0AAV6K4I5_9ERIC|nr:hypothetical protein RHGRI_013076 [Rhododendron griersonianum]